MASIKYSFTEFGKYIAGLTTAGFDGLPGPVIPPGLETVYSLALGFIEGLGGIFAPHHPSSKSAGVQTRLASISLFVRWQNIYNSLSDSCKDKWVARWEELPYGSHAGAGGYPGSGFSAFVHDNAQRLRNGESLIYCIPDDLTAWNDNFESYSTGTINGKGNWTSASTNPPTVSTTLSFTGSKSLYLNSRGPSIISRADLQGMPDLSSVGNFVLSFNIYPLYANGVFQIFFYGASSVEQILLNVNQGSSVHMFNRINFISAPDTMILNAWNLIEMEFDNTVHQARIRVGGGSWSSWLLLYPFQTHEITKLTMLADINEECYVDDFLFTPL